MDIDISSKRFNNLTREERNALYKLRDNPTIIIKAVDKGSAVVFWDREDYLKEAYKQLEDKDVYEEVQNDSSIVINTIMRALEKIRIRGDLPNHTLNYFLVKDPKFARFYLLPEIHKRLHNVPGRPTISTDCMLSFTYVFQSESTLYSCLNVKELLARNRCDI